MIVNNQKTAVNMRIKKALALLILVISIGLIYFADVLPKTTSKHQVAIIILIIITAYFLYDFLRNHQYIYYTDTGDKFILRYFSLRPLAEKKNAIEFNKKEFYSFELTHSMLGFHENVIIYRKTSKGVAKYPPVSITALSKTDREKMISSFQNLLRVNKSLNR